MVLFTVLRAFSSSRWHVCIASRHRFRASVRAASSAAPPLAERHIVSRAGYVFVIRVKVRPRESGRRRRRPCSSCLRAPRALMPEAAANSGSGSRVLRGREVLYFWLGSPARLNGGVTKAGDTALCLSLVCVFFFFFFPRWFCLETHFISFCQ